MHNEATRLTIGEWAVDPNTNRLRKARRLVVLEPRAMDVLVYLANRADRVVSVDELIETQWGGRYLGDNPVYRIVAHLRRSFGDDARNPRYIQTIPKRGYQLIARVTRAAADSGTGPVPATATLPIFNTSFVGRVSESAELALLIQRSRLVTLTGPGGAGKTRLALHIAHTVADTGGATVRLLDLSSISDATLVAREAARVLDLPDYGNGDTIQTLCSALAEQRLLFVIDNCEHVIDAAARLIEGLLKGTRDVHVLATSREALHVLGETLFVVPPLGLPTLSVTDRAELMRADAARLLIERASASVPDSQITAASVRSIVNVCRRLDGLPLALELAGARARSLGFATLDERLARDLRVLTGASRSSSPRQRTLEAAIAWSYDLLEPAERRLFRRLAIFAGWFTLRAVECICGNAPLETAEVVLLLANLVEKSLVQSESAKDGHMRYRLLETIHCYALEAARDRGELAALRREHLDYYRQFAAEAREAVHGPTQERWYRRLADERDNLRAALDWSLSRDDAADGCALAASLGRFWHVHSTAEGYAWLERALSRCAPATPTRADLLCGLATLKLMRGRGDSAARDIGEAVTIARQTDDIALFAHSLSLSGYMARNRGDLAAARSAYEEVLRLRDETDDPAATGFTLGSLGDIANLQGDLDAAWDFYRRGLTLSESVDHLRNIAAILDGMAMVALRQDKPFEATRMARRGLRAARRIEDALHIALHLHNLGVISRARGHTSRAGILLHHSLMLLRDYEARDAVPACLDALGALACDQARYDRAAVLFGAADGWRETAGQHGTWLWPYDKERSAIETNADEAVTERGHAMSLESAIDYALDGMRASRDA